MEVRTFNQSHKDNPVGCEFLITPQSEADTGRGSTISSDSY